MDITVNQQAFQVTDVCSIQQMLSHVSDIPLKGIAVAINQTIIPKRNWEEHLLCPGDQVMIIKATQGG